ncbi:hypothetical protein CWB99_15890 [Pseudoalteromonas rubra]|uniref:Uncharacterized protein n=1 Tax=Pseudoalteromonas rubra TaxID=43658 RepID=A0A5S3WJ56_9GAMM|nr:hypothetical protein [Pseudoalteromonas rubra]TMP27197.1 hypothetical protein CWB99_15890 [Pseudoalteromonas rubra]TMP29493.1 hypothetical protein CWC00_18985 [Pseudoalteromonas rubra]
MESIVLRFDGEALNDHSMDLKLLADSLAGLESLITEVHEHLNGSTDDLKVQVQGGFEEGSFEFLLNVIETAEISTLAAIGLGGTFAGGGLIGALKWLGGEPIEKIARHKDGDCILKKKDGNDLVVSSHLKEAIASPSIRTAFKKLIQRPLNKEGIDVFEVLKPGASGSEQREVLVEIEKREASSFRAQSEPVKEKIKEDDVYDNARITFLTVHKDKPSGWRIHYDDTEISGVKIQDDSFIRHVQSGAGEAIFDDAYRVKLVAKYKNNSLTEKSWHIEKVYL